MTRKTDFGKDETFIFSTPSGLWIIIHNCAYKLIDVEIDSFNFDYGRKTQEFNSGMALIGSCSTYSLSPMEYGVSVPDYTDSDPSGKKEVTISLTLKTGAMETAHIDKLHQIFDTDDIEAISRIMNRKFNSLGVSDDEDEEF